MIKPENIAFDEMGSGAAQIQRIEFDGCIREDIKELRQNILKA